MPPLYLTGLRYWLSRQFRDEDIQILMKPPPLVSLLASSIRASGHLADCPIETRTAASQLDSPNSSPPGLGAPNKPSE